MTKPKRDFLLIEAATITQKRPINTTIFGKTLLLIEQDCEQHTNVRLWMLESN